MEVTDIDKDGDEDIILNGYWFENPDDPLNQEWPEHNIDEKWYTQVTNNWQDNNCKVTVADMDMDDWSDVILAHSEKPGYPVSWYRNPGDPANGLWTENVIGRIDKCHNLKVADFDFDGDPDIAGLRNYNQPPIEIWRNLSADNKTKRNISGDIKTDFTPLSLEKWHYIQVDNQRPRFGGRTAGDGYWFGLAMGDLNGDGFRDIASGKWVYLNPTGVMEAKWIRNELVDSLDALLIVDVDNDEFGDIIAAKCGLQFWLEAKDLQANSLNVKKIGELPVCDHGITTQGYNLAQIIPGGKPEILLNADGVFYLIIPENPGPGNWPFITILEAGSNGEWISSGDINGDGRPDLVVTEELWPGMEPDASMYWFEAPEDPAFWNWTRHTIVTRYSMNNLDVADTDRDGDIDIVTCEHKGPAEELQVWENDGSGNFILHVIDRGKESHAGARLSDLDQDGDKDIVSIAWNDFEYLHVWRNDAIKGTSTGNAESIPLGYYLTDDYRYFIQVTVTAEQNDFTDKIVEIPVDLSELKNEVNEISDIDPGSLRFIEVNKENTVIDKTVMYRFNPDQGNSMAGQVAFMVKEGLQKGTTRYFRILFGPQGGYYVKPVFPKLVNFDDYIQYQGQQSYQVQNLQTVFLYHKQGGDFAGMFDKDGNDWICYRPDRGSGGEYRGIPNIRHMQP